MSKPTLATLKSAVNAYGGTIDGYTGRHTTYNCDSPPNTVWIANGCHCICVNWTTGDKADKADAIVDAIDRFSYGIEPCEDAECEYCYPVEE